MVKCLYTAKFSVAFRSSNLSPKTGDGPDVQKRTSNGKRKQLLCFQHSQEPRICPLFFWFHFLSMGKNKNHQVIQAVTFFSSRSRSLNHWKGHLATPKTSQIISRHRFLFFSQRYLLNGWTLTYLMGMEIHLIKYEDIEQIWVWKEQTWPKTSTDFYDDDDEKQWQQQHILVEKFLTPAQTWGKNIQFGNMFFPPGINWAR